MTADLQITMYGAAAERFEAVKTYIGEQRGGIEPTNPEVLRLLMENFDVNERGL